MTEKEKQEMINHWAKSIIPVVFLAESELKRKHPEWKERLLCAAKLSRMDSKEQVSQEYCRAIAEEIMNNQVEKT